MIIDVVMSPIPSEVSIFSPVQSALVPLNVKIDRAPTRPIIKRMTIKINNLIKVKPRRIVIVKNPKIMKVEIRTKVEIIRISAVLNSFREVKIEKKFTILGKIALFLQVCF